MLSFCYFSHLTHGLIINKIQPIGLFRSWKVNFHAFKFGLYREYFVSPWVDNWVFTVIQKLIFFFTKNLSQRAALQLSGERFQRNRFIPGSAFHLYAKLIWLNIID
jgi:hypothetical protein